MLPGLFSHAEAVAAVAGVGVICGCYVNRAELQLAVIRHHLYSLYSGPGPGLCRPAADIADPEPRVSRGRRIEACCYEQWGHSLWDQEPGMDCVAGTNMFVVVAALLISPRV